MNDTKQITKTKADYEAPVIDIIRFSCADILTTSGIRDENQGEWDPQNG